MRYLTIIAALFAVACSSADAGSFYEPSPISFGTQVAEGQVGGWAYLRKFGEGAATTTEALVATGPTKAEAFPTSAEAIKCISDDADDTAAGSGLRTIDLYGLDASWNEETTAGVAMAGLSYSSDTTETYIRLNRGSGMTVGTYGTANQGTITCIGVTSGDTKFTIPPGHGQTLLPFYSVPDGKHFHMELMRLFPEGSKLPTVNLYMRPNDDSGTFYPERSIFEAPALSSVVEFRSIAPAVFPERTDIYFMAATTVGTANINAEFEGFIVTH